MTVGFSDELPEIRMDELIEVILIVLDARDTHTFSHFLRVTEIEVHIARDMGLHEDRVHMIHEAAYLHDIGKVGIPDLVLNKAGRLTREDIQLQNQPYISIRKSKILRT